MVSGLFLICVDVSDVLSLVNFYIAEPPTDFDISKLSDRDKAGLEKGRQFTTTGGGYMSMHATRPSTIGIVLSSSPLALLAW
jgi:microsomal epoxide hydrolase